MNDILFGNNNSEVITKLSKRYFKKNKVRNLAALLAIILTAFLFTSITSLAFNMASSIQLSLQMQKGSKADGTLGYMTEEQYEQLVNSDFVEQAGHRRIIGYQAILPAIPLRLISGQCAAGADLLCAYSRSCTGESE